MAAGQPVLRDNQKSYWTKFMDSNPQWGECKLVVLNLSDCPTPQANPTPASDSE
jgi:hypothetical protein